MLQNAHGAILILLLLGLVFIVSAMIHFLWFRR